MTNSSTQNGLRSGELARLACVSADTLRHYERKGVIAKPLRTANGYRLYPAQTLERVRLVRRALSIGFTLDELASILGARDRGRAPCKEVRALAAAKLAEVETRLRETLSLRADLRLILKNWDEKLSHTATGERAELLEALAADAPFKEKSRPLNATWRKRKKERTTSNEK